ncbi:L-type lectin-domain containing receptor kinase IX.1-like [Impatiens glandulifera]|uniref:L-type lectin-domain containing receptor kinase IX.1-like n=1 Tax=Impatiens glandulifera TaxID=253017 RepID=UPI001FB09522|nr:L-type lectin-domain containing receptor kinase IX.1-like [Impatiens glandulifera]
MMLILIIITLVLILPSLNSAISGICQEPFNISFTKFDPQICNDNSSNLICYGPVSVSNGSLEITPDYRRNDPPATWQIGRVLYRQPVPAWPASFCSVFTIRILRDPTVIDSGDGMSFIIAQDNGPPPENSYGSYIGIFNESTEGVLHQVAIELDTWRNEWDIDDNHVAIDIKNVKYPIKVRSLSDIKIDLKSGKLITFQIEYDGWSKNLHVSAAYAGDPLVNFLSHSIKMKKTVPSSVFMGFTASTGPLVETHQLLAWNLSIVELPNKSLEDPKEKKLYFTLFITTGGLILIGMMCIPIGMRIRKRKKEKMMRRQDIETFIAAAKGPKLIPYRKLSKATRNFSKDNLLGTGGFGSVYKGVLSSNPPLTIAVKKVSSTSRQGEKEYLAEICTIGRLRHKNLVQLQGWCHEHGELLLVYEFMPNGSLDRYIGKRCKSLDWPTRYNILQGLASALLYLHEECDNPVVHRDVKPNNVMLDAQYVAHLGDFGLAKLLHNETAITTKIAGTPGYVAPEVSFTGRATLGSDVYSFGMVILEVVCGQRKKGLFDENGLVDEVWEFREKGDLLDCVDKRLENKYDPKQAQRVLTLGLACLHPDYLFRPGMRKAVQIFVNPNEPIVGLPETRPDSICLTLNSSSTSNNIIRDKASLESTHDEITISMHHELHQI